jgi:predicted ATPase/DNA-binding CsgD family transcriptional regulator
VASDPPFVGRLDEMDLLRALLTESTSGSLRAVVIEGEAGIGKSRLLRQVNAHAQGLGFRVLTGVAEELERHRAFGVFIEMARSQFPTDPHAGIFTGLTLESASITPKGDGGFVVTEEIITWLETCAAKMPVLLSLEDLHWADISTLATVNALVRRLSDLPLLVVLTLRPPPRPREVDRLLDQLSLAGTTMLRLPPLSEQAVVQMASAVLGASPGPRLREQISDAAGNPLFVLELLRAIQQQEVISITGSSAEISRRLFPADLRQTLLRRYSFLSKETMKLLQVASILGSSFSVTELAAVCDRRPVQLITELQEAISSGLVEEPSGERLAFRHDLFRQALYEDMPVALRTALHRDAGRALATMGASVIRVAEQLSIGDPYGVQTLEWLWRAARESAVRSTPLAVRWYERALDAVSEQDPRKAALISELVPQLVLQGRVTEAQEAAAKAITHAGAPDITMRLRLIVAHALTRQGRWNAAREQLELGAAQYDDPIRVAVALAPISFVRLITGEVSAAVRQAVDSKAAAEAMNKSLAVATCLMTLTIGTSAAGASDRAIALGLQGLTATEQSQTSFRGLLLPQLCLGVAYMDADLMAEAERSYRNGLAQATRLGTPGVLPYFQANLAILLLHTGVWDDARSEAEACLALAKDTGTRWSMHALATLARIAIAHRDFKAAARIIAEAEKDMHISGPIMGANWVLWAKALLLEAEGHHLKAFEIAAQAWDILPELRFLHTNFMIPTDVLRIALRAQDIRKAAEIVEETEKMAERFQTASAIGAALQCRAMLDADPETALAAVTTYEEGPRPVEHALASSQAAVMLAESGAAAKARLQFRAAVDTFAKLGLNQEEDRITAAMRARGIHRTRRRLPKHMTGWNSLTATELTVSGLVAQGMSNPEIAACLFMSRYTVETHLKHIFTKLAITSRAALASEVMRHGSIHHKSR